MGQLTRGSRQDQDIVNVTHRPKAKHLVDFTWCLRFEVFVRVNQYLLSAPSCKDHDPGRDRTREPSGRSRSVHPDHGRPIERLSGADCPRGPTPEAPGSGTGWHWNQDPKS